MDDVFALLNRKIDEYEEDIKTFLAAGQAEDIAMYNRIVGRYEALQFMKQDLNDIEKRYVETQNFFMYLSKQGDLVALPRKVTVNLKSLQVKYVYR